MTRMRILLAASTLLLAACAVDATGVRAGGPRLSDGDSFRMLPGTSVTLPGEGVLRYASVVNDSRCKPGVQCIWAGDAELAFEWRPTSGVADAFRLHTGKLPATGQENREHRIGNHVLTLEGLGWGDAPEAQLKLDAATQ
jgi:hypothetical protein